LVQNKGGGKMFGKFVVFDAVQDCPSANNGDACGVVVALRTSTGCCFGGDSMGRPWVASPSRLLIVEGLEHVEL